MSGLRKQKKYDWKDSNLAMFGSDTEKQVKKESAQQEAAWQGAGKEVGLQIWRIVKFEVKHWPQEDYGKFFSGDSYIILNTYKEPDGKELKFDLHFWIGKESTQDEYGTAAYKTVELDTLLNDAAVQHREVQGHESTLFKSYFKTITTMKGGADTGFNKVEPKEYKPRLLKFKDEGKKSVKLTEVAINRSSIDNTDVFILDMGLSLFLWRGEKSSQNERLKGLQQLQAIKSERHGKCSWEVLDQGDDDEFFETIDKVDEQDDDDEEEDDDKTEKLLRVTDEGGELRIELVKEGSPLSKTLLDSKDVFILDTSKDCIVWIGKKASNKEKKNGIGYAHKHLQQTKHPFAPVSVVKEGQKCQQMQAAMTA